MEKDERIDHIPQYDTSQRQGEIEKSKFASKEDVAQYAISHVFREDQKGIFLIAVNSKHETVAVSPFSNDDLTQNTRALVMGNAASCFLVADEKVDHAAFIEQAQTICTSG